MVEGNICSMLSCSPDVVVDWGVRVYSEHMPARSRTCALSVSVSVVDILGLYNHTNHCGDFVVVNTKVKLHPVVTATK